VDKSKERVYSVTEVSSAVKELLEENLQNILIKGEISNYSSPASGHVYFTLKDESNQIKVAWFGARQKAQSLKLNDGSGVMVRGRVSAYGKRSEYQVIASECRVEGIGSLLEEFEKLKKKLLEAGLFDASHKRVLPKFPKKIAIVTSPTGAVIRDIIHILTRRYQLAEVLVYPVMVQGDTAAQQIIKAINDLNDIGGFDVIILARGGGSMEDLWAFNDETLAYAIYGSEIPVISAVGHEVDYTIADFVADLRAPTPSAAAEIVAPDMRDIAAKLDDYAGRIMLQLEAVTLRAEEKLERLVKSYGFKMPFSIYEDALRGLDDAESSINREILRKLSDYNNIIDRLNDKLGLLNPLAVLKKGYSVVYDKNGGIISDALTLKEGDSLLIRMNRGEAEAKTVKIRK